MNTPANPYVDGRGWVLVDRLLAAMLAERVVIPGKTIAWGTVLPDDVAFPAGRVQRLPGGGITSSDAWEDVSRIEVGTWGTTRGESDDIVAQVRHEMAELSNDEFAGVGVDRIREETGPGRLPDPNADLRFVPTTWVVTARRQ